MSTIMLQVDANKTYDDHTSFSSVGPHSRHTSAPGNKVKVTSLWAT